MKVVVTGAGGQLGEELCATPPSGVKLHPYSSDALDVTNQALIDRTIRSLRPDVIINAAAYTDVDRAETQSDMAYAVNSNGAGYLASAARNVGAKLVHISTDFVFDGSRCKPYLPTDQPGPLSVYGASKLAGEERIASLISHSLIIRTSWLYSIYGRNFVTTMLHLMQERRELSVVTDQIGAPTWACELAKGIWLSIELDLTGTHHWTDSGIASWYDFAVAIQEEALDLGILERSISINPVRTKDYPTAARRPAYSVLDRESMINTLGYTPPHWRVNLRKMLKNLKGISNG